MSAKTTFIILYFSSHHSPTVHKPPVWLISLRRNAPQFCQNALKKAPQHYPKFFLTPSTIFIAFLCMNFYQMSFSFLKKIYFISKNLLILFLLCSYYCKKCATLDFFAPLMFEMCSHEHKCAHYYSHCAKEPEADRR